MDLTSGLASQKSFYFLAKGKIRLGMKIRMVGEYVPWYVNALPHNGDV